MRITAVFEINRRLTIAYITLPIFHNTITDFVHCRRFVIASNVRNASSNADDAFRVYITQMHDARTYTETYYIFFHKCADKVHK